MGIYGLTYSLYHPGGVGIMLHLLLLMSQELQHDVYGMINFDVL